MLYAPENEQEHLVDDVHDLVIVVFESHLEIETGEFGQVPVGVGVLSPKDRSNLVHPLHISSDGHLLSQLRGLCQEGGTTEVVDLEYSGTGFGGSGLKLGGLNLGKSPRIEERSEEIGDAGTNTEDGMGDWASEVNNSVGETSGLANAGIVGIGAGKLGEGTPGILDLEWKHRRGCTDHMQLHIQG